MHGAQETTVKLGHPIPVYLGYWTARISADGILQFRDDLYGIDARQGTLLTAALEKLKTRATSAAAAAGSRMASLAKGASD
jgi:murein L,D-transpeptidase YcbB/YkuD